MTDESNEVSGFEFVEKKLDDFEGNSASTQSAGTAASKSADSPNSFATAKSILTAVTTPISTGTGNILSNIAPPSALPTFITNLVPVPTTTSTVSSTNESDQNIKSDNIKSSLQNLDKLGQSTQSLNSPSSEKGPQVLIAPDSPTRDAGAAAASLFTWVKDTVANSNVLSKVAEKAKSSVNSMITTLDPQMREFIYSGGDIEIIVASEKEAKVSPVREAFQNVFGNATVNGIKVETAFEAAQPVGFAAGIKAAQERIAGARKNSSIPEDIPIVAVENFLLEVGEGKWFDLGVILLEDLKKNISLQTFTQMTPVPSQIVETAQESTPDNYSKDGFSVTIGSLMGANLQVSHTEWHKALTGVSRKDIIFLAAQSLAGIYKNTINPV